MSILESFILGFVQGATEFLPISSSGHLAILQNWMNISEGTVAFTVFLHLGSLVAVIIAYKKSIVSILKAFVGMCKDIKRERSLCIYKDKYRLYFILLIIATIPTAIIGLLFEDKVDAAFSSMTIVGVMLLITGILLYFGEKFSALNTRGIKNLKPKNAFIIGLFQSCALFPGLSRSGTTMVGGFANGLKREDAAEFSFLLSIPAVLGATLLKVKDIIKLGAQGTSAGVMIVGFVTSLVVGYFAIKLLVYVLKNNRLKYFSYYCWAVGLIVLIMQIVNR